MVIIGRRNVRQTYLVMPWNRKSADSIQTNSFAWVVKSFNLIY